MPGRQTQLSETQIVADLLADRRRQAAAVTSVQMPQPAKDTFTVAATPATTYTLSAIPYQGTGGSSLNFSLNGVELIEGVDYTCDYTTAIVTVSATLKGTPTPADVLTADYWTTGDLIALSGTADLGGIFDNFNRADNTTTGVVCDLGTTSDGTATWTNIISSGTIGISSNQAYAVALNSAGRPVATAMIDVGSPNGSVQCTFPASSSGAMGVRMTDGANTILVYPGVLDHVIASNITTLATWSATAGVSHVVKIVMNGSSLTVYQDGSLVASVTDSTFSTVTTHGLWATHVGDTWDDWSWAP